MYDKRMDAAWWSLRVAFFLGTFLAGLDKFFHFMVNWDMYLDPIALRILGPYSHTFMLIVGVVEMIVGLMVITAWPRLGGYLAALWLLCITISLVISGVMTGQYWDIALRDVGLCLGAFAFGRLSAARMAARVDVEVPRESERLAA